jgi:hypothetical protein
MVRDKVRDKVGRVPWNTQFRRRKTGRFEITARQDQRFLTCGRRPPGRAERPAENACNKRQK